MMKTEKIEVNDANLWRLNSPNPTGWARDVRSGSSRKKYFIISCDTHLNPPFSLFKDRIDKKYHDRLPRMVTRDGQRYLVMEGLRDAPIVDMVYEGEDLLRANTGGNVAATMGDDTNDIGQKRVDDLALDGVDGEVIFPNGPAGLMWSSTDPEYVGAQARVWNDWAWEVCAPYKQHCNPAAALAPADIEGTIKEVERVAKMGYRVVTMPCKPIFGDRDISHINYNLPVYDPLWAAIQEHDLTITYHVSTGQDPRAARGNGGAIINYVVHATAPIMEPIVSMCSSGVFERFPNLRVATIEADAGWVPWMMQKMDEAYLKHHFWVRPKLQMLPSEYYRTNCSASFGEDAAALDLVEKFGLENNLMWANDYPHHEGSWPHSAEAIERTFDDKLKEDTRAKLLGLNAARVFRFDIPKEYLD